MYKDPAPRDRINSFALVAYIPDPLAGFLDRLRQELVPNCFLRAHATILPPRPISTNPEEVWNVMGALVPSFAPFDVEMTEIEVFPISDVIFVKIGHGSDDLTKMHDALNVNGLRFEEPFPYRPHITLAQELQPDELDELLTVARARWAEFSFAKSFRVEKLVFVQNTRRNEWIDLGECTLGQSDSKLVGELTDLIAG